MSSELLLPVPQTMATDKIVSELKQRGAIEAAQDPNSDVTSADAQASIVKESKNAGVPAFTFNHDASPEEKKAQVRAVRVPSFALRYLALC